VEALLLGVVNALCHAQRHIERNGIFSQ